MSSKLENYKIALLKMVVLSEIVLQKKMKGKGAVMACDFNAQDTQWHCTQLAKLARQPEGLVLGIFFAPKMVLLSDGKYAASDRKTEEVRDVYLRNLAEAGILPV